MHECALRVFLRRSLLVALMLGLSLSAAGCSPEPALTENRAPATKHLKYIDELQKKGAATKAEAAKGH